MPLWPGGQVQTTVMPTTNVSQATLVNADYALGAAANLNLNYVAGANAWTCNSNAYSTYAQAPTTSVNIGFFRGTIRFPLYTYTSVSYTLGTGPNGFPASWVAGDSIRGFCNYGFDSSGPGGTAAGISIGTVNGSASPTTAKLFTVGTTTYGLRQMLYNATRSQALFRMSIVGNTASPPTNAILGLYDSATGDGINAMGTLSAGTQENVGGDLTTYWTLSGLVAGGPFPVSSGAVLIIQPGYV